MSDPSLHPFARDLVASCKEDVAPENGAERMLATLGLAVPVATLPSADNVPTATGGATAGTANAIGSVAAQGTFTSAMVAKWVTLAALAGVVAGAGGYHVVRERLDAGRPSAMMGNATASPPGVSSLLAAESSAEPPVHMTPPPPEPPLAAPRKPRPPSDTVPALIASAPLASPAPPSTRTVEDARALDREMAQVTYVRSLVEKKEHAEALQAIGAYRANLGNVFEPEMRALEVEATFGLGRTSAGKELARRFLDDYPRHPAASRVRGLLEP